MLSISGDILPFTCFLRVSAWGPAVLWDNTVVKDINRGTLPICTIPILYLYVRILYMQPSGEEQGIKCSILAFKRDVMSSAWLIEFIEAKNVFYGPQEQMDRMLCIHLFTFIYHSFHHICQKVLQ